MTAPRVTVRSALLIANLIGAISLPGCSGSGDSGLGVHRFIEESSPEGTLATSTGAPKYTDPLFRFEEVTDLKEDERPASLLSRVSRVLADEHGDLYVVDSGNSRIAVFDPTGRYVRDIGGQGEGPAEYGYPDLVRVRKGVVSIYDGRSRRLLQFRTDGTFIHDVTVPRSMRSGVVHFERLDDGRVIHVRSGDGVPQFRRRVGEPILEQYAVTFLSSDEDTLKTLRTAPLQVGRYVDLNQGTGTPSIFPSYTILGPRQTVVVDPDLGILVSEGQGQVLIIYGLDGRPSRRIRVAFPAEPVEEAERVAFREEGRRLMEENPDERSRQFIKGQMDAAQFADSRAPWNSAHLDDFGYIWLWEPHIRAVDEEESGTPVRVLAPSGEYLGECVLPAGIMGISRGLFIASQTDPETDLQHITVYRILPAIPGLSYP